MTTDSTSRILEALKQAWTELDEPLDFSVIEAVISQELQWQFRESRDGIDDFLKARVDEEIDRRQGP